MAFQLTLQTWIRLKEELKGEYNDFNDKVTGKFVWQIFTWDAANDSAREFALEDWYDYHVAPRPEKLKQVLINMQAKAESLGFNYDKVKIYKMLLVRLGNIWYGVAAEHIVINYLNSLEGIKCKHESSEVDKDFKVDAVVYVDGKEFAIQVKTEAYKHYDDGKEYGMHSMYTEKFGRRVFYLYYNLDITGIILNETRLSMVNKDQIIQLIKKIAVYC